MILIIEGAEPFFLKGNSQGVLLIHGFTGLPAELLLLGEFLNRAGFTVLGVRLAGHGTNVEDFAHTNKTDWCNSVLDGYAILSGVCDKIFVIGHSMGGLLALKLSLLKKVEKIVTLAAPIFIAEETGIKTLPPRKDCGNLSVTRHRKIFEDLPPAVNNFLKETPLLSIHEMLDLLSDVKNLLPKITAPILIMHGLEDHTAKFESADYIAENIGSEIVKKIPVENAGHLLPFDEQRDFVFEEVLKFLK